MRLKSVICTIVLLSICSYGQQSTSTILAFQVDDAWAGQAFRLNKSNENTYTITHEVYGSGIPVVSSDTYPVTVEDDSTFHFSINKNKKQLKLAIKKRDGKFQLYLEGLQLKTIIIK